MKKLPLSLFGLCLLVSCTKPPVYEQPKVVLHVPASEQSSEAASNSSVKYSSRSGVLIDVPFAPQAPLGNWDALHQEACEEMSLLLVHAYLEGRSLSPEIAEADVQAMIAWETENGYGIDVTMAELGAIAERYLRHRTRIVEHPTADLLRRELERGNPVIVPLAGQRIGNPFYSGDGPPYHVLVLTGFTEKGFITNDVGTRRGKSYFYPTDVLMRAIHDWTGSTDTITTGASRVLLISKKNP